MLIAAQARTQIRWAVLAAVAVLRAPIRVTPDSRYAPPALPAKELLRREPHRVATAPQALPAYDWEFFWLRLFLVRQKLEVEPFLEWLGGH